MNFTKSFKLSSLALATSLAFGAAALPTAAQAGASASFGAANMYLWRGLNLTPSGGQISGSLDYAADSGMYAGIWTTTEDEGSETDLYFGYGGEAGGMSYDVSYWKYWYPEERGDAGEQIDQSDSDYSEYVLSVGYGPATLSAYLAAESDSDDNNYYTLDYAVDKFTFTYGWWDLEEGTVETVGPDVGQDEYSHIMVSYAATDALTFAVSKASSDLDSDDPASVEEDPLFLVSYSLSFDL